MGTMMAGTYNNSKGTGILLYLLLSSQHTEGDNGGGSSGGLLGC